MFRTVLLWLMFTWFAVAQSPNPAPDPIPEQATIEVDKKAPDDQIEARLTEIFAALGDFDQVDVSVDSGVVTLSGEVNGSKLATDATELARRIEGVIYVRDQLERVN